MYNARVTQCLFAVNLFYDVPVKEGLVGFFHIILSNIVLKFSQTLIKAYGSMYFHKVDRS